MKKFSFFIIFLLSGCASLQTWDKTDIALTGVMLATTYIDYHQTKQIAHNPEKYHEINPILGRHPAPNKVDLYFLSSALVKTGIATAISSSRWRKAWLEGNISLSLILIGNNLNVGLELPF